MQKTEINELRRLRAVQLLLKRNAALYEGYAGLEKASRQLGGILDQLDAVLVLQEKGSKSTTLERNQHREALEQRLLTAFSHLQQVAEELDLDGLRRFAAVTPSRLKHLKAEELSALGILVLEELELHSASLEETGFTAEDRLAVQGAWALHKQWMPATREVIELRKVGTASVPELLKRGLRLVKRQMLGFMERYRLSHPDFYREYQEAKKLKRVAVRHEEEMGVAA
jgi:hypothetical protein